jgi:hypothetical protein
MNKISLTLILVLCFSSFYAQDKIRGDGQVKIENTIVDEFETLSVGNELEVVLIKSKAPSVTIKADGNLHTLINFEVKNGNLEFKIAPKVTRAKSFKAEIRYSDKLNTIVLHDDVDVTAESGIQLPELNLILNDDSKINAEIKVDKFSLINNHDENFKMSTNCKLEVETKEAVLDLKQNSNNDLRINTEKLDINMYDNAEVDIEGFAYDLNIVSIQSSSIKGKDFLANNANVNITEKSEVEINVSDALNLNASGNSTLTLYGTPKINIESLLNKVTIYKKEL